MAPRRKTEAAAKKDAGLDREGLSTALSKLRPALRAGGAIVELEHLWLDAGQVSAYDGGLGIRLTLETGVACGVPGKPLMGLLATSALKDVSFEVDGDALVVKMGRSRTRLNVLSAERDPWPFPEKHGKAARLSAEAVEALRSVLIAKAQPATRLEHHGVAMYANKDDLEFYATDSRSIVNVIIPDDSAKDFPEFTFIPRPLAEQIVALCPHGAELFVAEDHMAAVGDGVEICSNVLDTTDLQDLPALVERNYKQHESPVAIPAGLEAALDRAEVLAGSGTEAVVTLTMSAKKLLVAGKFTHGDLREELTVEGKHPDAAISVVSTALRRGLLASDELSITKGSLAFYGGGESFLCLVAARS